MLLRQKQQSGFDQDMVTNGQLKQMCDNVLQLLTNTVQHTESVMSLNCTVVAVLSHNCMMV